MHTMNINKKPNAHVEISEDHNLILVCKILIESQSNITELIKSLISQSQLVNNNIDSLAKKRNYAADQMGHLFLAATYQDEINKLVEEIAPIKKALFKLKAILNEID